MASLFVPLLNSLLFLPCSYSLFVNLSNMAYGAVDGLVAELSRIQIFLKEILKEIKGTKISQFKTFY